MSRKKNIRDLDSLNKEIIYLKKKAIKIQHEMDDQLVYLKEHSGSMLWNSLLKREGKHTLTTTILAVVLQNENVQGLIRKFSSKLADFIGKTTGSVFTSENDAAKGENHN